MKKLFLPFYFSWMSVTDRLSDEECGRIVKALSHYFRDGEEPEGLSEKLELAFIFMSDTVKQYWGQGFGGEWGVTDAPSRPDRGRGTAANGAEGSDRGGKSKGDRQTHRYGSFDVNEAFQKALERSYGTAAGKDTEGVT